MRVLNLLAQMKPQKSPADLADNRRRTTKPSQPQTVFVCGIMQPAAFICFVCGRQCSSCCWPFVCVNLRNLREIRPFTQINPTVFLYGKPLRKKHLQQSAGSLQKRAPTLACEGTPIHPHWACTLLRLNGL